MKYIKVLLSIFLFLLLIPFKVYALESGKDRNNINWTYEDGVLTFEAPEDLYDKRISKTYYNDSTYLAEWYSYKDEVKKIVIKDGIDIINPHAFEEFADLEEVIFPKSMSGDIGSYAFYNCPKLKSIKLPDGISRIGDYAFYGTGITTVELPIFLDWIYDNTFNEGTNIIRLKESEGIIAAGTAGKMLENSIEISGEGKASENTCYNKTYFGRFYDDTAYWKLSEDGTLTLYGNHMVNFYAGSRLPWGCYKNQVKKIIINDDILGDIVIDNNVCTNNNHIKIAVYSSKTVEDMMSNRIDKLSGLMADCREDCIYGFRNLETIVINRGVDAIISGSLNLSQGHVNDIYISKYVKTIDGALLFHSQSTTLNDDYRENNVHINVSFEDYKNNNYNYKNDSASPPASFFNEDGSLLVVEETNHSKGNLINEIDDTYVSINDSEAPETINIDGKEFYKYETYLTNTDGIAHVSLPNDDSIEYYVKIIDSQNECTNVDETYKVDTTQKRIYRSIKMETQEEKEESINVPDTSKNRSIGDRILIYVLSITCLCSIIIIYKKIKNVKIN